MYFEGRSYYFLSAIELKSRQSWAKRVKSLSIKNAKEFLEEIFNEVTYPIHTMQTDNGSEFKGLFDQAIEELETQVMFGVIPNHPKQMAMLKDLTGQFKMNLLITVVLGN